MAKERTRGEMLKRATRKCIEDLKPELEKGTVTPQQIEGAILKETRQEFIFRNSVADKNDHWRLPTKLEPAQIAEAMTAIYTIKCINTTGSPVPTEQDPIGIYMESGPNAGTYVTDELTLQKIASEFDFTLNPIGFRDVLFKLRTLVDTVDREKDPDLICVNNGIFDYRTKKLSPHTPERVFLCKSHVDYIEDAENPIIEMPDGLMWDVVTWMNQLSDDPEISNLLWEGLSAIVRPMVSWNKSLWLYSQTGNNGKGTYCELARNIVGYGAYASIQLDQFSNDFMLEPLIRAQAIIVDENDVGIYIDRAANLKAVTTNDVITINRKYKTPIAYRYYGFMIQCLNEYPKIRDRSDSFYRRQLFVPMNKCFTGATRDYIKTDYLRRPEVLQYVLKYILNTNFYKLSEPASCKAILEDFKESNDPTLQFWLDTKDEFKWDLLPFTFLYQLYQSWYQKNVKQGQMLGRNRFQREIINLANKGGQWICLGKDSKIPASTRIACPEPLIDTYSLKEWMSDSYQGPDRARATTPDKSQLAHAYRGLIRTTDDLILKTQN